MLRRWFADMSVFAAIAVALFVFGSGFVLADLQSASLLQWTGTEVPDVQSGGIAYYSFHGVEYTMDVPMRALGQSPMPSTVYLDPGDPSHAMFSRPLTKWIEAVVVLGSYAASALVLAFGFARRSQRRHRSARVTA
ncbi:MAG: hypothetical protein ACYDDU_08765 [Dermatophilaceae bacterium]